MPAKSFADYDEQTTGRCERVLGSVLRGIGSPWRERVCLVGGLVPRYLVPNAVDPLLGAHIGSTDIDVALGLAVGRLGSGAYHNLENNLKGAGLARHGGSSWQWAAQVDGHRILVELLGDDSSVPSGTLFRPKISPPAGAGRLELLCVRGVELALLDFVIVERELEMLDGALSTVELRVAGLAPFVALKADAYLDRREPKDVYDLLFVLRNWPGGPRSAGRTVASSPIARNEFVVSAVDRISGDFATAGHVGPRDYERFADLGSRGDESAAIRDEAVLVWSEFTDGLTW
jgi:hypothetical protein